MAVFPQGLPFADRLTPNKGASIVVWLLGAFATSIFLKELGIAEPICFGLGAGIQFLMTRAEAPLWQRGVPAAHPKLAATVLVFDTLFNAAGTWPYLANLGSTNFWSMVSQVAGSAAAPTVLTRAVLALTIGLITAAGPEILWSNDDP